MRRIVMSFLFVSQVIFAQWIQLGVNQGLPSNSEEILSIGVIGNRWIIGTAFNGLYLSDDNGDTWRHPTGTEPLENTNLMATINNRIIAGSAAPGQGVFISDDNGENWSVVSNGLNQNGSIFSTRLLDVANSKIYLSSNGLFVSTDNGDTWEKVTNGLPVTGDPNAITAIDTTYFCTWSSGSIIRTSTDGVNWQNITSTGLPGNAILREIIAVNTTLLVIVQNQGIYRSTDFGVSWNRITGINEHDQITHDLFVHNNVVYAATSMFVYQSSDEGVSWAEVDANYPKPSGMTIVNTNDQMILAGQYTSNSGQLWKHAFSPTGIDDREFVEPVSFILEQNYPNPFNPGTTIIYELPQAASVKLTVTNMVGQEVAELVNGFQPAGRYQVQFNAAHLASEVYFYHLQTKNLFLVRKMVLMK